MPSNEPTSEDRQRLAFEFLQLEALEAHQEGDGLRVGLLCQTALDGIEHLVKDGQIRLPLRELRWVFIFHFYWLLDHYAGNLAAETLKKVPRRDQVDEQIASILECHQYLIQEPIAVFQPAFERLCNLPIEALSSEPVLEESELIAHLIELAWFRSAGSGEWRELLGRWQQSKIPWVAELASTLRRRLEWQTRMVAPWNKSPLISENEIQEVQKQFDLADLWLLHLHGRREAVISRVRQLSPHLLRDSYRWRVVSDFWHIDRPFGPTDHGDQQGRWLARRRSLTANSPLLQFHDRRETRIEEKLAELFRARVASNASSRFAVMQLAMLHEIAAMRLWDYGMWREATRAQSEAWLEATRWMTDQPRYAAQGLLLGARSLSLKSSSKDLLTRTAIERLEFAPKEALLDFTDHLLIAYPMQSYCASELIEDIADLLPPETWEHLAEWTAVFVGELKEKRSTGQKIGPAAFWWKLFASLEQQSSIWNVLLAEALEMAGDQHCWDDDRGYFLSLWVKHAPLDLARQVAEAIVKAKPTENIFSLYRAELLTDAEDERPELHHEFTGRLPRPAPSREERMLLAEYLNIDPDGVEADAGREVFARKLSERLELMVLPEGQPGSKAPSERLGIARVKRWEIQHRPLLDKLLAALQHPSVITEHVPEMLNALQWMIANGPAEFASVARARVVSWLKEPPGTKAESANREHPFSIYHTVGPSAGETQKGLGWIIFQYVMKEGADAFDLVEAMTVKAIRDQWQAPSGILCRCLIILASKLPIAEVGQKFVQVNRLLDVLRVQIGSDENAASNLSDALNFIAGLVGPNRVEWINWESEQGKMVVLELMRILSVTLPATGTSPNVTLRMRSARLLAFLKSWQELPEDLATLSERLAEDNRARVRRAAK